MTQQQLKAFDDFLDAYLSGLHRKELAKKYNLSVSMISAAISGMRALGILDVETAKFRRDNIGLRAKNERAEIADAFLNSGLNASQFRKETGICNSTLHKCLKEVGEHNVIKRGVMRTAWKYGEITQEEFNYLRTEAKNRESTNAERVADVCWQLANESKSLQEVGEEYGVSREYIRQIMNRGARYLRDYRAYGGECPIEEAVKKDDWQDGLSGRARNVLNKYGIDTRDKFLKINPILLRTATNCGFKTLNEIEIYQRIMRKELEANE